MIIHFICRGNAYRSRLAEAYLNSKQLTDLKAISSGLEEKIWRNENGPITWLAQRILQNNRLIKYMSFNARQTDKSLLDESDLIIIMNKDLNDIYKNKFKNIAKSFEVWNIKDTDDYGLTTHHTLKNEELKKIEISEKTFNEIKEQVDFLVKRLTG